MMTNLNVGDKVLIVNVAGIMFGGDAWDDNEVTSVVAIEPEGIRLVTTKMSGALRVKGVPTFLVTKDEYVHLAKLLPVDGAVTQVPVTKEKAFKRGDRVRVKNHPYALDADQTSGTVIGYASPHTRGDYEVKLDGYMRLSFKTHEMEAL